MGKVGYLSKKISKGKTYIYLRKSYREGKEVKNEYLYSFGPMPHALEKMYSIRGNPDTFPKELTNQDYDLLDLNEWILTLETKLTSTGRSFEV
ncbi:hypothetical protein BTS2_3323 [Bacillus sp. TS-2]|nr:hypothetical protein BTS2_3323 [Bacillus sp. TS-2]